MCAEALQAVLCPPGCHWAAPENPGVNPFSKLWTGWHSPTGRPAPSRMAVRMAVCLAGPPCLTVSLAPVGIFLEMRCGQGGRTGWEDGNRGRLGGEWWAVEEGAGLGKSSSWCLELSQMLLLAMGKAVFEESLNPSPRLSKWAHLVSSRPCPGGQGGRRILPGQLPALVDSQVAAGQKLGWALQLCPAGFLAGFERWGVIRNTWALSLCLMWALVRDGWVWVRLEGLGGFQVFWCSVPKTKGIKLSGRFSDPREVSACCFRGVSIHQTLSTCTGPRVESAQ